MLAAFHYNHATIVPARQPRGLAGGGFDSSGKLITEAQLIRNTIPVAGGGSFLPPRNHLKGEFVFAGYIFDQFGHFILESCSRLWFLRDYPKLPLLWLLGARLLDYQLQLLDTLGVRNPHFFITEPTSVDVLHIPQSGYRIPDFFAPEHAEFMAVWADPKNGGPENVWLSRSALPEDDAHIYGEPRIEEILRSNGWTIFHPESSPIAHQLDVICGAKHVAGFMGSAFHLLILANATPERITIFTRGRVNANYSLIAKSKLLNQTLHQLPLVPGVARKHKTSYSLPNPSIILRALGIPDRRSMGESATASSPSGTAHEATIKPPNHSARRINTLVDGLGANSYLEIGVALGETFRSVSAPMKTAVGPAFRFEYASQASDDVRFFEMPSDEFFLHHARRDVYEIIFLDGLHTFEQSFRDFCCTLNHASRKTVWLINGTIPNEVYSSEAVTMRRQDGGKGADWQEDAYKIVFAIHDFFPTMSYRTIASDRNAQTVVWCQPRLDFKPLFNSMETISRLSWVEMRSRMAWFYCLDEEEALQSVLSRLTNQKGPIRFRSR